MAEAWTLIATTIIILVGVTGVLVVLGLIRTAIHHPASATGDPALAAALDQLAGKRTRRLAAATIDLDGALTRRIAYIDADANTRFEIGSVTKGLTGMLVADSIARQEITMQSTLGSLSSRYRSTALESVTVEQLCTHTSGLPSMPRDPWMCARSVAAVVFGIDPYRGMDVNRVARCATRQRLRARGRFTYSNLGAAVLGHALAEHVGSSYADVLNDRILTPLAMTATSADPRSSERPGRGWTMYGRRSWAWSMSGFAPAGGVVSTVTDMAALAEGLLDGRAPGGDALLPMAGSHRARDASVPVLFWMVNTVAETDRTEVWHNGQTGAYSAFVAVYPQSRRAVVILANVADAHEQQRTAAALIRWVVQREAIDHS